MKKSKYTGWKDVYAFTFVQTVKGKTFLITVGILCIIALCSMPIYQFVNQKGENKSKKITTVETVYVVDESDLDVTGYDSISTSQEDYSDIAFVSETRSVEEITKEIEKFDKKGKAILLHITKSEAGSFALDFIVGTKSGVKKKEVQRLAEEVQVYFTEARMEALEIAQEQMDFIQVPVVTEVVFTGDDGVVDEDKGKDKDKEVDPMNMTQYYIMLGGITLIIFIIAFSGEAIATSIITEKSTRVIEYLMITIEPLAIIMGKILAMLTTVILQFVLMGVSFILSNLATALIFGVDTKGVLGAAKSLMDSGILVNVNPIRVVLAILMVVTGFLFYGTLAGLFGASVSKIEQMAEGLKIYNFIMIIGAYMGIGLGIARMSGSGSEVYKKICYFVPISSPFVVPSNLLIGEASIVEGLIAFGILSVSLLLLFMLVSRVYEYMIFYNGATLKLKDVIRIAKDSKGGASE